MIDKIINYNKTVKYVKENGWDNFFKLLQREYPDYKLYSVSTGWYNNSKYVCKAKGILGDIIINWAN